MCYVIVFSIELGVRYVRNFMYVCWINERVEGFIDNMDCFRRGVGIVVLSGFGF